MSRSLFGSIRNKLSGTKSQAPTTDKSSDLASNSPIDCERQSRTTTRNMGANPFADPQLDNPPPYSATSNLAVHAPPQRRQNASPSPSLASVTNDNDKYAFLSQFDTIFVVDDSGSMAGSRWKEVDAALQAIAPICTARDKDGVDLYFLNHRSGRKAGGNKPDGGYYNITSADTVKNVFNTVRPSAQTPTGARLYSILKPYVDSLERAQAIEEVKPVNVIIITDGVFTDDPEGVIVQQAQRLDTLQAPPHQVGLQFFQVGNDADAREALEELDNELVHQKVRDMVDTATWDEAGDSKNTALTADHILKIVLGAVVRKLDRKSAAGDQRSRT